MSDFPSLVVMVLYIKFFPGLTWGVPRKILDTRDVDSHHTNISLSSKRHKTKQKQSYQRRGKLPTSRSCPELTTGRFHFLHPGHSSTLVLVELLNHLGPQLPWLKYMCTYPKRLVQLPHGVRVLNQANSITVATRERVSSLWHQVLCKLTPAMQKASGRKLCFAPHYNF